MKLAPESTISFQEHRVEVPLEGHGRALCYCPCFSGFLATALPHPFQPLVNFPHLSRLNFPADTFWLP